MKPFFALLLGGLFCFNKSKAVLLKEIIFLQKITHKISENSFIFFFLVVYYKKEFKAFR